MKLVDPQRQALLFRTAAREGMSNGSRLKLKGVEGNLNPKELIPSGLEGGRAEGHPTSGLAAPSSPGSLRFKASEWCPRSRSGLGSDMPVSRPGFAMQWLCDSGSSVHLVDSDMSDPGPLPGPTSVAEKTELASALPSLDQRFQ